MPITFILFLILIIAGYNINKSSSQNSEQALSNPNAEQQMNDVNNWFNTTYKEMSAEAIAEDPTDPEGYRQERLDAVVKGFKFEDDDIIVIASLNQMKAEGFTQDEVGNWGLNVILSMYEGELPKSKNRAAGYTSRPEFGDLGKFVYFND